MKVLVLISVLFVSFSALGNPDPADQQRYWNGDRSQMDLRGRFYAGQDLRGINFSNSDLRGADFENADLRGANFTGADMRGARLWGTTLSGMFGFNSAIFSNTRVDDQTAGFLNQHGFYNLSY